MKSGLAFALLLATATVIGLVLWLSTSFGADAHAVQARELEAPAETCVAPNVATPLDTLNAPALSEAPHRAPRAASPFVPANGPVGLLLVRAVWKSNGEPAINVGIQLLRKNRPMPLLDAASLTDASGTALFASLECGEWIIRSNRGAQTENRVARDQRTEVRLELEDALCVAGQVTTHDGRGAPHAKIWIRAEDDWVFIADCDSAGGYSVAGVPWGSRWIATADGAAPSHSTSVAGRFGSVQREDFVLGGEAARIRVQVLDVDGAPVPRAVATLEFGRRESPETRVRWTEVCDAQGCFAHDGVSPGDVDVTVQAAGFAATRSRWNLMSGDAVEQCVRLERAANVDGEVRIDGRPLANATVLIAHSTHHSNALVVTTDADGGFRIEGLGAGRYRAIAISSLEARSGSETSATPSMPCDFFDMELVAGQTTTWIAELRRRN